VKVIEEIKKGESERLEFKEVPNDRSDKWLKTVVAFANCRGGRILFGVDDNRKVVGLVGDIFAMKDAIADSVANACVPTIPVETCISTINGKTIIILEIAAGRQTPYYLKSKGDVAGVYVRYDATTRLADEMSLKELRVEGSGRGYDEILCRGLSVSDGDVFALCERLYQVAMANATDSESRKLIKPARTAQLVKWGVLKSSGQSVAPTNAYALLAGSDFFSPVVKCAVFKGTDRSVFVDRREISGPIDKQIEESYKYVLSKINLSSTFGQGIYRKDVYEIPPAAIREIIVNAVVHRSYVNGEESPITVALYDDRLEVTSPGKLPHGVTVEKMLEGCSECRNKALAQALAYMNIIEDWGSGIPRICRAIRNADLKDLEIQPWPNAVRMVIYRQSRPESGRSQGAVGAQSGAQSEAQSQRVKCLVLLKACELGRKAIAQGLGTSNRSGHLSRILVELVGEGLIEPTLPDKPNSRLQKYRLTEKGLEYVKSISGHEV